MQVTNLPRYLTIAYLIISSMAHCKIKSLHKVPQVGKGREGKVGYRRQAYLRYRRYVHTARWSRMTPFCSSLRISFPSFSPVDSPWTVF